MSISADPWRLGFPFWGLIYFSFVLILKSWLSGALTAYLECLEAMRASRALIPACPAVSLPCSRCHGSHELVDSMVSWLGVHRPVLCVENPCSFLDHPLWSLLFFSAHVSESPKFSPPPQLSETLTWLGFLLSTPDLALSRSQYLPRYSSHWDHYPLACYSLQEKTFPQILYPVLLFLISWRQLYYCLMDESRSHHFDLKNIVRFCIPKQYLSDSL